MAKTPDPWYDALDRWTTGDLTALNEPLRGAPVPAPDPPAQGGPRTVALTRPRIVAVSAAAALLLGAAVTGGVLAFTNRERADDWRDRSVVLQDLVARRTSALNRQTARLNAAAATLRKAQESITRSEKDVTALEARQRELANEKAQIEDQRGQLIIVAQALDTCNDGLIEFINTANGGGDTSDLDLDGISRACRQADDAVQSIEGLVN